MVHKDTSSSYRSVDCIGLLILLGLALCLLSASVSSWYYIDIIFLLTSFSLPFSELNLVGLPLDLLD